MTFLLPLLALLLPPVGAGTGMVRVEAGTYPRFYPIEGEPREARVDAFWLDVDAVSEAQFAGFVRAHPRWARGAAPALFVDEGYLRHWEGDAAPGGEDDRPVTRVSWFAARAYCEARGARLPTEAEWEWAARASATAADAGRDAARTGRLLEWYSRPGTEPLPAVGGGEANYWGVRDLHGVIWEWVEDFNAAFTAGDSRERSGGPGDRARGRYCGAGAVAAADADDYASFMRLAFRSALRAPYTSASLGFRCARDAGDAATAAGRSSSRPGDLR